MMRVTYPSADDPNQPPTGAPASPYAPGASGAQSYGAGASAPGADGGASYGAGPYGQVPGPNPYGAASWDTGAPTPAGPSGWMPAPKQGLFPLRPLVFGEILGATFKLLRTMPGVTIGSSLLISFVTSLLAMAAPLGVAIWLTSRLSMSTGSDQEIIANGGLFWMFASIVPTLLVSYLGSGLLQSVITQVVAAAAVGAKVTFGEVWRRAWTRVWALVGYYFLVMLATLLAVGVVAGFVLWAVALGTQRSSLTALPIVLAVVFGLALIVVAVWVSIKLLFVPAAIVLEGLGPFAAIRRSWRLCAGYFWRTLGITWLLQAIVGMVGQTVLSIFTFVPGLFVGIFTPTGGVAEGQEGALMAVLIVLYVVMLAVSMLVSVLTTVLISGNAVILYSDLRMRKEGLNIHLQRDLEERAAGTTPTQDPWTAPDLGPVSAPVAQPGAPQWPQAGPQPGAQPWNPPASPPRTYGEAYDAKRTPPPGEF